MGEFFDMHKHNGQTKEFFDENEKKRSKKN